MEGINWPEYSDEEEFEDCEEIGDVAVSPRRYIRGVFDPFDCTESEFKLKYRFSKACVRRILLPMTEEYLRKETRRGLPVTPVSQLLVCLRFFATACFQAVNADLWIIHQSSVSRTVKKVAFILASFLPQFIRMPSREKRGDNWILFQRLGTKNNVAGLPNIDGAIDCTHIRLANTRFLEYPETFRNRKSYFSLNVQAVVGPKTEFLDLVPEWPGSEHDARIFRNSRISVQYEEGLLDGVLVGDSGYPCLSYLLTPIQEPVNDAQKMFNKVHARTRVTVERAFGILKRRFPCLSKGLGLKIETTGCVIVACAVLHNIALLAGEDIPDDHFLPEDDYVPVEPAPNAVGVGFAMRQELINTLYSNLL